MQILTNGGVKGIQVLIRLGKDLLRWTARIESVKVSYHIRGKLTSKLCVGSSHTIYPLSRATSIG